MFLGVKFQYISVMWLLLINNKLITKNRVYSYIHLIFHYDEMGFDFCCRKFLYDLVYQNIQIHSKRMMQTPVGHAKVRGERNRLSRQRIIRVRCSHCNHRRLIYQVSRYNIFVHVIRFYRKRYTSTSSSSRLKHYT